MELTNKRLWFVLQPESDDSEIEDILFEGTILNFGDLVVGAVMRSADKVSGVRTFDSKEEALRLARYRISHHKKVA